MKNYMAVRNRLLKFKANHPNTKIVWITGRAGEGPDDMVYHFARWEAGDEWIDFFADWDEYGKSAGFIRNADMAEAGQELILIWDGRSNGSAHMRDTMRKLNKPLHVYIDDVDDCAGDFEVFDFTQIAA